jgi:hypothetical protein
MSNDLKHLDDPGAQELLRSDQPLRLAYCGRDGLPRVIPLLVRGIAAIEIVNGVAPEYIEASAKTLSGTDLEEFEAQVRGVFEQQARISITPERVRPDRGRRADEKRGRRLRWLVPHRHRP